MTIRISFSDTTVRVAVEINGAIESKVVELPQRTWVGLTDKELEEFSDADLGSYDLCLEVEAKLRSKNI